VALAGAEDDGAQRCGRRGCAGAATNAFASPRSNEDIAIEIDMVPEGLGGKVVEILEGRPELDEMHAHCQSTERVFTSGAGAKSDSALSVRMSPGFGGMEARFGSSHGIMIVALGPSNESSPRRGSSNSESMPIKTVMEPGTLGNVLSTRGQGLHNEGY
jgi:hypothetical protein